MFVFIIAFAMHFLLGWPNLILRIISRLLLLPVIAGLSYELLKWAGRSDNIVVKILSLPGLYLQKITTKEPDRGQLEVAIAAINAVQSDEAEGTRILKRADIGKNEIAKETKDRENVKPESAAFYKKIRQLETKISSQKKETYIDWRDVR